MSASLPTPEVSLRRAKVTLRAKNRLVHRGKLDGPKG
jgi:hypothetical protein